VLSSRGIYIYKKQPNKISNYVIEINMKTYATTI